MRAEKPPNKPFLPQKIGIFSTEILNNRKIVVQISLEMMSATTFVGTISSSH